MYSYKEKCIMNLSDNYTLLYSFIAESIIDYFGEIGESAIRKGLRKYGTDRGVTSRNKHLNVDAKINMKNLFSLYHDLPNDPRFRRELQELNDQERVSHTLICPMADIWKEYGHMAIGRMYCEEFHNACYSAYAYGYTQVNLAKTLTQKEDEYCSFNVVLRPDTLPEELKAICFEEYDPLYEKPDFPIVEVDGKGGFNLLTIKIYYYLLEAVNEELGETGVKVLAEGLMKFAGVVSKILIKSAEEDGIKIDSKYIYDNFPINMDVDNEPLWEKYSKNSAKFYMKEYLCKEVLNLLNV